MKLGIITAMDEELKLYLSNSKIISEKKYLNMTFHEVVLFGRELVIVKCGVGKVHASLCSNHLIEYYCVDKIIFSGVAGNLNKALKIGDIVISKDCANHDFNCDFLGFPRGTIPYSNMRFFKADDQLIKFAKEVSLDDTKILFGRVLTGDVFVNDKNIIKELQEILQGDCVEMEGAAIAQTCYLHNKGFLIVRAISDDADHNAPENFQQFVQESSDKAFNIVSQILNKINRG